MTTSATPTATPTPRQQFLDVYEREHATTMKVLRAYPPDQAELRPHPKLKTARELAWVFVLERGLGTIGLTNALASGQMGGALPPAPERWEEVLSAIEAAHVEFRNVLDTYSDEQLQEPIKFFGGPGTLVDMSRLSFAWLLLHDQIHHRGQMSIYLRIAGGRVPSIYGPTADEPWY
jgi:uncharacterized damage-inducible protein DinB